MKNEYARCLVPGLKVLGGKDFCCYFMWKTNCSRPQTIWWRTKIFRGHCLRGYGPPQYACESNEGGGYFDQRPGDKCGFHATPALSAHCSQRVRLVPCKLLCIRAAFFSHQARWQLCRTPNFINSSIMLCNEVEFSFALLSLLVSCFRSSQVVHFMLSYSRHMFATATTSAITCRRLLAAWSELALGSRDFTFRVNVLLNSRKLFVVNPCVSFTWFWTSIYRVASLSLSNLFAYFSPHIVSLDDYLLVWLKVQLWCFVFDVKAIHM